MSHHNALIVIDDTMPVERALATLKKNLLKDGLFKEMQKRAFYEKPSIKKRRKQTAARKKIRTHELKKARALEEQGERIEARKQFGGRVYVVPKKEVSL
jgi:small subunit ribosomal protein S21